MAACHPNLKAHPGVDLFLSRFADSEWRGIIRPWLEDGRGRLERVLVVAPTRGQTQALKQRCLSEGVPLLGVEFLTPGLARRKRGQPAGMGRSLQVLVLRDRIAARLAGLSGEDPARGLWKSLESDIEAALEDFEDLVRGGFGPEDFPRPELREVFGELLAWAPAHGYALGPVQDLGAGLAPAPVGSPAVADRLLILAGGAEGWRDFFGLAALARRCPSVAVVLSEPEFRGKGALAEEWVEVWQKLLGVEARAPDIDDPAETCVGVADLWGGEGGSAERADVLVGRSKSDEMALVADAAERLLSGGSETVAVIFPRAGPGHSRLMRLLAEKGISFADLIGTPGTAPVDTAIQRALVDFYERGCRLEELLALWPLLRVLNLAKVPLAEARHACERLFDDVQSHSLEIHVGLLEKSANPSAQEVARVARLLLPGWPESLSPAAALTRFEEARGRLGVAEPEGWHALQEFARRAPEPMSARVLLDCIRSFLPEQGPAPKAPGRSGFARVTLTTIRRAAGIAWSDAIFVECNSGERREPSIWLGDEERAALNRVGRFSLGVQTHEQKAAIERRMLTGIARDTRVRLTFTAARFTEEDPEVSQGPDTWLERVMWAKGLISEEASWADGFGAHGRSRRSRVPAKEDAWLEVWLRRRDPSAPFDEHFLCDPSGTFRPTRLSAKQIELGVEDPARLWFEAVLRARRVGWGPFARARRKAIGTLVHRVLARALRGAPVEGPFFEMPVPGAMAGRLEAELSALRARLPADRYWDSFHVDVVRAARELTRRLFELPALPFAAAEVRVPEGATVPVGDSERLAVEGLMDLVLSDRPAWNGSRVEIADFKTGGDARLSARRMNSKGASLQLGVYLHAALSVGATGSIWMLKPEERPSRIGAEDLDHASARLSLLGLHLKTGTYGALTPDRSEHTHGFEWPLACAPISQAVLEEKFARTFGEATVAESEEAADE
jgi:hypothetical protein